jgi:hypothetical protein
MNLFCAHPFSPPGSGRMLGPFVIGEHDEAARWMSRIYPEQKIAFYEMFCRVTPCSR